MQAALADRERGILCVFDASYSTAWLPYRKCLIQISCKHPPKLFICIPLLSGPNHRWAISFTLPCICRSPGPPLPPQEVQVQCGQSPGFLQVRWKPPLLTSSGTSNGASVIGYAVCTKGQKVQDMSQCPAGELLFAFLPSRSSTLLPSPGQVI